MIRHIVLCHFRSDIMETEIETVKLSLAALKDKIPGIVSFKFGKYDSPEGLNKGFNYGFTMDFENESYRDAYLPHPEHEKIKPPILNMLEGGIDGIITFDYKLD